MSSDKAKLKKFDKEQLNKHLKAWQEKQSKVEGCYITMEDIVADLSKRLNVSESAIEHWKKGHNKPSDYTKVLELAAALEIEPEDLEKENNEKDMVISMTDNKVIENNILENTSSTNATENTMEQIKLMSSSMNDMFDMMKKYQEISGTNKNAIISVYYDISDFLETYRSLEYGADNTLLADKFNSMYRNLRKFRLEIPRIIYNTLEKFMTEYLLMIIGIDNALPLYLKDADSRMDDIISFASDINEFASSVERTKMTKDLWAEYLNLRKYIISKNSCIVEYKDSVDELYCNYEMEEYSETSDYVIAAIFVSDLYGWLHNMWFLKYECLNWYFDNVNLYKTTCIKDAYRHLDEILSVYIP